VESLIDFAELAQIEMLVIDNDTTIADIKKELRWNQAFYYLARGL
jgi:L-arabinose isomerase